MIGRMIDELAKVAALTKQDSAAIVETVFDRIAGALKKDDKVEIRGFGSFKVRQCISEPPLTPCDRCGGPVHRLLSATPFILKGGGWYVTDYPSESRKKAQSTESSGSGSDSSSKEAAAKDAKPAESKSRDSSSKGLQAAKVQIFRAQIPRIQVIRFEV